MTILRKSRVLWVALVALALGTVVWAGVEKIELADAEVFFEFNSTDNDLGLQVFLDGEGWKKMKIKDPDGNVLIKFKASGPLKDLGGITELRFESAEPSPEGVLDMFPEGEYDFIGRTVDGDKLVGEGELSHELLDPTEFSPCDGEEVELDDVVIEWEEVDGVVEWEVIVEGEDTDTELYVRLPAEVLELEVPEEFLEEGAEYKIEILAIAENGNKTITESTFVVAEDCDD